MHRLAAVVVLGLIAAACGDRLAGAPASGTPSLLPIASATALTGTTLPATPRPSDAPLPTPVVTPVPTPSPTLTPPVVGGPTLAQLKYRIVDRFGRVWFCDPDQYPIARSDPDTTAEQRFPEVQKDADTFSAIIAHLGIAPASTYTHAQKVLIYADWKMLAALRLDPSGAVYAFSARFTTGGSSGTAVDGTVDASGTIVVRSQVPTGQPPCPICLARGTRIATPDGSVAVEDVREGMRVWTLDSHGARVVATVERTGNMTAPSDHEVVRLMLDDGRELHASPAHQLADGRVLGSLSTGDVVDGALVVAAGREPYGFGTTFDLLPSGPTGVYWADGVLLRSTIAR